MWLSSAQARWLGHLYHASICQKPLSTYAQEQDLSLADLLAWEDRLAGLGISVPQRCRPLRFVTVEIME